MQKLLLIIMDGIGISTDSPGNAVTQAKPQNLIKLWNTHTHGHLLAASEAVGLPPKTNGNSEVGHLNLGAGRIMYQNLPRINKNIENENFFSNSMLLQAVEHAQKNSSNIHLLGCLSDGSIHSHIDHFIATLNFLSRQKLKSKVFIHAFTDGRDSPPQSAAKYIGAIEKAVNHFKVGQIATICGRAIAMDRNKTWSRTEKAYRMLVHGEGMHFKSWKVALQNSYKNKKTDEFIEPTVIQNKKETSKIQDGDVVLFLNFRSDRAIQLSKALADPDFANFTVQKFQNLFFASMVEYEKDFPQKVIYPKEYIKLPLGRIISEAGLTQLRIAESEKFPHVTYFLNGGVALRYNAENRIEIPSPKVATYDHKPEMASLEIVEVLKERIAMDYYNFIALNLANADMVAHTGNMESSKLAVEVVDYCVAELTKYMLARGGTVVITADHGNAEELINRETGKIDTEHSMNPVPLMIIKEGLQQQNLPLGKLSDVAPTILSLMNLEIPSEMSGRPLVEPSKILS